MMLLAVALLEGRGAGWPAWIVAGLALAASAFWTFHRLEHSRAALPACDVLRLAAALLCGRRFR
jgi:hypothetical protein